MAGVPLDNRERKAKDKQKASAHKKDVIKDDEEMKLGNIVRPHFFSLFFCFSFSLPCSFSFEFRLVSLFLIISFMFSQSLGEVIGRGAFGSVFRGLDLDTGNFCFALSFEVLSCRFSSSLCVVLETGATVAVKRLELRGMDREQINAIEVRPFAS